MNIPSRRPCVGLTHQFGKFDVTDLAGSLRGISMSGTVEDELLPSFHGDPRTLTDAGHLPAETVLGIRSVVVVQEHVVRWLMWVFGQPLAQLPSRHWERNDSRLGLTLLTERLVVWQDPEAVFQVHPFPNQTPQFRWTAAGHSQSDQDSPKPRIALAEQCREFRRRDNTCPHPGSGLHVAAERILQQKIVSNGPAEKRFALLQACP